MPLFRKFATTGLSDVTAPTSFTPVIQFGGASTGITYSLQAGTYYKIGKLVFCTVFITLSSKGSATGGMAITGLPVTSNSASNAYVSFVCPYYQNMLLAGAGGIDGRIAPGATAISLSNPAGTAGQTDLGDTHFTNTSSFLASVVYLSA